MPSNVKAMLERFEDATPLPGPVLLPRLPRIRYDYATVAYDASSGAQLWVKRYAGPGNPVDDGDDDNVNSLGVSPDGSKVFVAGLSPASNGYSDYATVAYDSSSGAQLWVRRYNGPANGADESYGGSLGVSPDGSQVFVTGTSQGSTSGYDYATVAYDASTGAPLWVRRYTGPANATDRAHALGVSPKGSKVFVTGASTGSNGYYDYATLAYSIK
jgi:WD40 repeat protein